MKRTPLHGRHVDLGARMVPFAGYEMPIQYDGIIHEHMAVRERAGLFDVSHMGEIFIRGPHALEFVQHVITNDAASLYDGRALYTVMCRENGGIVDDLIVYRMSEDEYLLVVNAANRMKDLDWMLQNNPAKADIQDVSEEVALIAVQGPRSVYIVEKAVGESLDELKFYHFRSSNAGPLSGSTVGLISRTGYTGELGIEIYCDAHRAGAVWDAVMEAGSSEGLEPAGLGARDTLRIEAGYCLYGKDITDQTNPLEAGLGWVTKPDKGRFIGKSALEAIRQRGPERRLVAFVLKDRAIPRNGYAIQAPDEGEIGIVTSGTQSPVLESGVGLGYVLNDPAYTEPGSEIRIAVRNKSVSAVVTKPPLHTTS